MQSMRALQEDSVLVPRRSSFAGAIRRPTTPVRRPWPDWKHIGAAVTAVGLATLLATGCGGDGISGTGGPFISSMSASPARYGQAAIVTVNGSGLNSGIALSADSGCDNLAELPGGDNLTRRFSCSVSNVGDLTIRARASTGREVGRLDFTIPQPQITLTVDGLGASAQTMVLTLDPVRAPLSVNNVLAYVNSRFYDGLIFHRADPANGVVQTGGYRPGPTFTASTRPPIALESRNGLTNLRGTVGMARTLAADSATSQFYFNVRDNPAFDYASDAAPGYAVFGSITQGLEVMDSIFALPTRTAALLGDDGQPLSGAGGQPILLNAVPLQAVVIRTARQTR